MKGKERNAQKVMNACLEGEMVIGKKACHLTGSRGGEEEKCLSSQAKTKR